MTIGLATSVFMKKIWTFDYILTTHKVIVQTVCAGSQVG
jgi:hypothetical protein